MKVYQVKVRLYHDASHWRDYSGALHTDRAEAEKELERADKNNLVKESRIISADSRFDL